MDPKPLRGVQLRRKEAIPGSDAAVYVSLSWKKRGFFPRGRSVYMEVLPVSDVSMCGYAVFICGSCLFFFFNSEWYLPRSHSASVLEIPHCRF